VQRQDHLLSFFGGIFLVPQHQRVTLSKKDEAKSWDALAASVDIPVRRIHEWRAMDSAPKNKSVSAWQDWIEENKTPASSDDDEADGELKTEKLREEVRKLRINNDLKEQVMVNEAKQAAQDLLIAAGKRLRSVLVGLVPARLAKASVGRSGPEIEVIARDLIETALQESRL